MRYYLAEQIGTSVVVVGEVIAGTDPVSGTPFPAPPAAEGDDAFTREQLLEMPGGRPALWA